ncbi:Nucleoid occlusion protein [bioreactor metagenome]|uniref:Nucleoid occlusion protein n=1 Tax=bioreactor metagenome TaxID=1076179 RepID=A0A644ZAE0_9ZZZZ|nr:nucleoid occlusion protein [Erysipelotrichaceae bacterium]
MKKSFEISIDQIKPNRYQPRLSFDSEGIFELAQSIRENGLIQPIVVRNDDMEGTYEIVAGERRYRACILAGITMIPAILMDADDNQSAQLALIENIQREDLSAIEEAKAFQAIISTNNYTQGELAKKVGKSQSTIANKIRLLELPSEIQEGVVGRQITERHARALLSLDETEQVEVYHKIIDKEFNVKQTEDYIKALTAETKETAKGPVTKGFSRNQQIAVNTIKQAIEMIRKMGIKVDMQEEDTQAERRIIIKFPKE